MSNRFSSAILKILDNQEIKVLGQVLPLYLVWIISLILLTYFTLSLLPSANLITHQLFWPSSNSEYWIRWANWDGGHYTGIAGNGYLPMQTVFFPLYPLLIRIIMFTGASSFLAGFLISQISTIVALFFIYKLALLEFGRDRAAKVATLLLIFPTSFFLATVYSESLFLSLAISAFYYARTKKWLLSAILAGLAAATRLVGMAVIVGVFVEYLFRQPTIFKLQNIFSTLFRKLLILGVLAFFILYFLEKATLSLQLWLIAGIIISIKPILEIILLDILVIVLAELIIKSLDFRKFSSLNFPKLFISFLPPAAYLIYLQIHFGSALSFVNHESTWNKYPTLPWTGAISYFNQLLMHGFFQIGNNSDLLFEFSFFILVSICLIASLYLLRTSYIIYSFLVFLISISAGTLLDLPRYSLAIFPLFFVLASIKNTYIQTGGMILSIMLMSLFLAMFFNSYWVP